LLFNTRETVVGDTPARLATSMMVGIWFGPGSTWLELICFQGSDGKAFPSTLYSFDLLLSTGRNHFFTPEKRSFSGVKK
jgi:hypothetical protein